MQKTFGLIGYPLGHSFSKGYFTEKFEKLGIADSNNYELFSLKSIDEFKDLVVKLGENIGGLNVTIPYKQAIIPFLDELDIEAQKIGAINTIKILKKDGLNYLKGYNTDYYGFKQTLEKWAEFREVCPKNALVLGNGGATKAIIVALSDLGINVQIVSRKKEIDTITYEEITEKTMADNLLIINTTPLGMYPNVEKFPAIPYDLLTNNHLLYDIVYNPLETTFLKKGLENGVKAVHFGLDMLHGQAEKAWEIWNL